MKFGFESEIYSHVFLSFNITGNYINCFPYSDVALKNVLICLRNLWDCESDMALVSLPLLVEDLSNAEPIFPYFVLKVNWFVPCSKPFSHLQRIFHIFSPSVWVAIVVVLFLVTVVSSCLAKQSNDIRVYTTMSSALYNIWAVTVGVSLKGNPRSSSLNCCLIFLFCIVFSSAQFSRRF
jgi:membrane protein insertase Oxa1/YidC/SpoIIIJ